MYKGKIQRRSRLAIIANTEYRDFSGSRIIELKLIHPDALVATPWVINHRPVIANIPLGVHNRETARAETKYNRKFTCIISCSTQVASKIFSL